MGELALMVWSLESWYPSPPLLELQPENSPPSSPTSSSGMDLGELAQSPPSKVLGDLFLSSPPPPPPLLAAKGELSLMPWSQKSLRGQS